MNRFLTTSSILGCLFFSYVNPVKAQVQSDNSVGTEVNQTDNVSEITGGTTKGENLFHSFQEFSLTSTGTAFFNNAVNIKNIIGRVTGGTVSNIDGLIKANGNSNLILINPNGINFGANARLDIGGSFLGSTANSIIFEDGTVFSANDSQSPLLTVSVPIGLQLGQNSGAINVQGTGNNLSLENPIFFPFNRGEVTGLKLQSGKTLGLVGGDITFTGGAVASESGRIELGSVAEGIVNLDFGSQNFSLSYENVSAFKDINLTQQALVDASGKDSGSIHLQGDAVNVNDGSVVLIQNQGERVSGNLTVDAAKSLSINGTSKDSFVSSGLFTEALASGNGGAISVNTPKLEVTGGASIIASSFGAAASGNLTLNIADDFQVVGFAQINPNKFSTVSAQAYGVGNAGSIDITTGNFTALGGGNVASVTGGSGTGSGGNINVNASDSIKLIGINPIAFAPSQITAGSGGAGNAGNVSLETKNLIVQDGGRVDASATASGNAGNLTINASDSIEVTGTVPDSLNPSLIIASANILDPELRQFLGLPDRPSGNSGSVTINTPQLQVKNGGQLTVRNDGTGNAGNLAVKANSINLSNGGGISAAIEGGTGGTINLEVADSINLTSGSQIQSDNFGAGDGGEITIAANSLNISDRAYITTTSFGSGNGGDISLNIAESFNIKGQGFEQFQQAFQASVLNGSLKPGTRGTGIFIGTAADGMGGNLQIDTNSLSLTDGAIVFSPIFASGNGGDITVNAADIEIVGSALSSVALANSSNLGSGGNIAVDTERLTIKEGGAISNATFGNANAGGININAAEMIDLKNTPDNALIFTGIYANTSIGDGKGGDINLKTANLFINDALVTSTTGAFVGGNLNLAAKGESGNILIQVDDTIKIAGISTDPRFVSGIFTSSFNSGTAGNIEIFTGNLSLGDGSEIAATTVGSGNGGNLTINAKDSIELTGATTISNLQRGGLIAASGRAAFPEFEASGDSGDINLTAKELTIQGGAGIDAQSLGTGSAGNLNIEVEDSILLDDRGTISAATSTGKGGNINIDAGNIFWKGNSTTTAAGDADGGNISIKGRNLVVLEASKLAADANTGKGGNINIDAQGLFICDECVVSASSRLGIDGIVNINTLEPNPNLEIVNVPIKLKQPEEAVAQACSGEQKPNASQLTISGRGGLPNRPNDTLSSESIVSVGLPQNQAQTDRNKNLESSSKLPAPAHNWYVNSKGVVVLTAQSTATTNNSQFNSSDCHVR